MKQHNSLPNETNNQSWHTFIWVSGVINTEPNHCHTHPLQLWYINMSEGCHQGVGTSIPVLPHDTPGSNADLVSEISWVRRGFCQAWSLLKHVVPEVFIHLTMCISQQQNKKLSVSEHFCRTDGIHVTDRSRDIAVRTLSTSAEMWLSRDNSPHSSRSDAKKSTTPTSYKKTTKLQIFTYYYIHEKLPELSCELYVSRIILKVVGYIFMKPEQQVDYQLQERYLNFRSDSEHILDTSHKCCHNALCRTGTICISVAVLVQWSI